tara:strand:- start:17186 stop:17368 length:183 start_codon:yes stop_codon:yes gene_type:complete
MKNILINIKNKILLNKNKKNLIAISNLEKKVIKLNIKSAEYLELAKKNTNDWKKKWREII